VKRTLNTHPAIKRLKPLLYLVIKKKKTVYSNIESKEEKRELCNRNEIKSGIRAKKTGIAGGYGKKNHQGSKDSFG
jgi:hypothetical protein